MFTDFDIISKILDCPIFGDINSLYKSVVSLSAPDIVIGGGPRYTYCPAYNFSGALRIFLLSPLRNSGEHPHLFVGVLFFGWYGCGNCACSAWESVFTFPSVGIAVGAWTVLEPGDVAIAPGWKALNS